MGSASPGPIYSLPPLIGYDKHDQRKVRSPQYSIGARLKTRNVNTTPGPNENIQGFTRYGRATNYAFSIAPRNPVKDYSKIGPGPAAYDLGKKPYVSKSAPAAYSFGRLQSFQFKNVCPGPNAYAIKDALVKNSPPAFSLAKRTEVKVKSDSPGPANYAASNLRYTMPKGPEYSLHGRAQYIKHSIVPGPNAYDRTNYRPGKSSPAYSFGVRHSLKAPPMMVPCDIV